MRQSTNSSQEQNEKAMSANSMFLIALLSYTLINQLGITKSDSCKYCLRLYDGTYESGPYTEVYKSVGSLSPPWIPGSVCVPLIHDSKGQPPYWRIYEGVNYSGANTAIGHGSCIDDFKKSGLRRISSIQKCVYKENGTVECISESKRGRKYCRY
ncbi:unnamed protein product [Schistosoma margrebowiei]|uniref:Uncharacterized protein n=1 Tax=Schistosoma margrebowiei TaxID=48269 RepID=A0A183N5C2_9TREM|nr:unnamed protein product [Schistosoma margrebowiei]